MGTTPVLRGVLAACAVSVCLLAAGCDSGGEGAEGAKGAAADAVAAGGAGKPAAELGRLLITQADLPDYKVEADSPKDDPGRKVSSDKQACEPLVRAQSGVPIGKVTGTAVASALGKAKQAAPDASEDEKLDALREAAGRTGTSVFLDSYPGKGAEEAFAAVKKAVAACADGYTAFDGTKAMTVEKVLSVAQDPAGDEALAYQAVVDLKSGQKANLQFVFVRKGEVLAAFEVLSVLGDAPQPPKAVVEAQSRKLG
ncbi:hypothetical protein [Streptomyces sp. NPDC059708]|uniref:hypothetical protein n=1 Tax=Streptomyces sp. NPDC059708 TaxID=3346916 RepID=UPI00367E01B7